MGRVFSLDDMTNVYLPTPASFIDVEQELVGLLGKPGNQQLAALVFGSAGYGTASRRSDFDYLLTYPLAQQGRAQKLARELGRYARDRFVVTDPYLVSQEHLGAGRHTIGESFLNHLSLMEEKGRTLSYPIVGLVREPQPAGIEFIEYLIHKQEWLNDWLTVGWETEADRLRGLQKILEMPAHIVRRYLAMRGSFIDVKAEAIDAYQELVDFRTYELLETLQYNDSAYTNSVSRTGTYVDAMNYEIGLRRIENSARELQIWLQRHFSRP